MKIYKPNIFLRNAHFNTLYPVLFRWQKDPAYLRKRFITADDDFIDIDYRLGDNRRLAVILHGLEGSSYSKYIIGTGELLSQNSWDVAAFNHRSCSGEINLKKTMYHSGWTTDLSYYIDSIKDSYEEIVLVGFSLGGNMALKYAGEKSTDIDERIKAVIGISVPTDLKGGSETIGKTSNWIYEKKFMVTLKEKMKQKAEHYPENFDIRKLNKLNRLYDFDDLYTGPIHGFRDANDYYEQCSSKKFIADIRVNALLINALDDPFLSESCFPFEICEKNDKVEFIAPKHGGHVGFASMRDRFYWNEYMILDFANRHSNLSSF